MSVFFIVYYIYSYDYLRPEDDLELPDDEDDEDLDEPELEELPDE